MSCTRIPLALVALALGLPLLAQDKPEVPGDATSEEAKIIAAKMRAMKGGKGEKLEKVDDESAAADAKRLGLEMPPAVTHGARGFCHFDAALLPKRLLPGQPGTVVITLILEGDAVLTSPAALTVKPANSSLQMGSWSMRPASPAVVAAFKGQSVYDNWGIIEVPVTMPSGVQIGSRHVQAIDLEFELTSGSKGTSLGRFDERVSVTCEVGTVADPVVAAGAGQAVAAPESRPSSAAVAGSVASTDHHAGATAERKPIEAFAAEVTTEVPSPSPSGSVMTGSHDFAPEDGGGNYVLLLGAGAAVVLVAIFLLLRRK